MTPKAGALEEAFWLGTQGGFIGFRALRSDKNGAERAVNDKAIPGWLFAFVGYNFNVNGNPCHALTVAVSPRHDVQSWAVDLINPACSVPWVKASQQSHRDQEET